jgi:hypothetical protein
METDAELETGYGGAAPAGDNLCNDYAQGLADGFMALATARGDRVEIGGPDVAMNDGGSPSLFGNVVVVRRPVADGEWPALAARIHDFYAGHDGGPYLLFSAWPTPDLTAHDFGRVGHPPLMYRPVGPVLDEPIAGFELRPVTDAATADDYERTLTTNARSSRRIPTPPCCRTAGVASWPGTPGRRRAGTTGSATSTAPRSRRRRRTSVPTTSTSR